MTRPEMLLERDRMRLLAQLEHELDMPTSPPIIARNPVNLKTTIPRPLTVYVRDLHLCSVAA